MTQNILKFLIIYLTFILPANALLVEPEQDIFDYQNTVKFEKIQSVILEALKNEGVEGDVELEVSKNYENITLQSNDKKYHISLDEFSTNQNSQRFKTKVRFGSATKNELIDIYGRYKIMVDVPALSKKMVKGDVISKNDLTTIKFEKRKLRHDDVLSQNRIIGKMLTRTLNSERPIRSYYLEREVVVSRRDNVEILFETPFMRLTAAGVALDDGAEGDLIRIRNTQSNKIIHAKVDQDGVIRAISTNNL